MNLDDTALIEVSGLTVRRRGIDLLRNVDLKIKAREIITIVGPNGAGKSTLLRAAMGLIKPDGGSVRRRPGLTIGYLPQTLFCRLMCGVFWRSASVRQKELGPRSWRRSAYPT